MRYLTTAALALVLAAGSGAALAQPQGQNNDQGQHGKPAGGAAGGQGGGQHGSTGGGQHGATGGGQHGAAGGQGGASGVHTQSTVAGGQHLSGGAKGGVTTGATTGGVHHVTLGVQTGQTGGPSGHRTVTQSGGQAGAQGGHQGLQFHQHALRGRDQGRAYYSRNSFQAHVVVTNRFHVSVWSRPSGWAYRPWGYGMFLPVGWFLPAYYLNWGIYDLPPPPIGCEWVREGPDAVLVDVWTGEVLSVYSGVFY